MKSLLLSILTGLTGGALAGLAVTAWHAEPSISANPQELRSPLTAVSPESQRADGSSRQLDDLRLRVAALEARPVELARSDASEPADAGLREELEALREELHAALARLGSPERVQSSQAFEEQVASAIQTLQKEERVAAFTKYQGDRTERLDQDLQYLGEKLGLVGDQSERLRSVILAQYEREAEQLRLYREGSSPEVIGELKQADGARFHEELGGVLTEEQRSSFLGIAAARRGGK